MATEFNPWTWKEMARLFFELLIDKRLDVLSLTTGRHSPLDAQKVYASLRDQVAGQIGIVFDWSLVTGDSR